MESKTSIRTDLLHDYILTSFIVDPKPSFSIANGSPLLVESSHQKLKISALLSPEGSLELLPSLYLRHLTVKEHYVSMKTAGNALLMFYRFMRGFKKSGRKGLRYDSLTEDPREGPLWLLRDLLVKNIQTVDEHGEIHGFIAKSTIEAYLRQIVAFYTWLIEEEWLAVSKSRRPFVYVWKTVKGGCHDDKVLSHTYRNKKLKVLTTDLIESLPEVQSIPPWKKLRPMKPEHKVLFEQKLGKASLEKRLIFQLALATGLRVSEMVTFSAHHIVEPLDSQPIACTIGSAVDGCKTKRGKIRNIEIPADLMAELYQYKLSDERLARLARGGIVPEQEREKHPKERARLFISNRSDAFSTDAISAAFDSIRAAIQQIDPSFRYTLHDLRATFATYWLHHKALERGQPPRVVATTLMALMGHENFSTTQKYVELLENTAVMKRRARRLNQG